MRGGFRIHKKQLKQAGWQVVEENKEADRQYQLILQQSDGEKVAIKGSSRAKAYLRASRELLPKVEVQQT